VFHYTFKNFVSLYFQEFLRNPYPPPTHSLSCSIQVASKLSSGTWRHVLRRRVAAIALQILIHAHERTDRCGCTRGPNGSVVLLLFRPAVGGGRALLARTWCDAWCCRPRGCRWSLNIWPRLLNAGRPSRSSTCFRWSRSGSRRSNLFLRTDGFTHRHAKARKLGEQPRRLGVGVGCGASGGSRRCRSGPWGKRSGSWRNRCTLRSRRSRRRSNRRRTYCGKGFWRGQ